METDRTNARLYGLRHMVRVWIRNVGGHVWKIKKIQRQSLEYVTFGVARYKLYWYVDPITLSQYRTAWTWLSCASWFILKFLNDSIIEWSCRIIMSQVSLGILVPIDFFELQSKRTEKLICVFAIWCLQWRNNLFPKGQYYWPSWEIIVKTDPFGEFKIQLFS